MQICFGVIIYNNKKKNKETRKLLLSMESCLVMAKQFETKNLDIYFERGTKTVFNL